MPQAEVTYRAVQAISPGKLELTRKPLIDPQPGYVRIRVEACGVCHTDAATVEGVFPIAWPRVPGHEAVGVIDKLGAGVEGWVGWDSASAWDFWVAVAGAANSAGEAISSIAVTRSSRESNTMVATGVAAMIETMPLEKAPEAYAKMMAGKARFRMVLTTQS